MSNGPAHVLNLHYPLKFRNSLEVQFSDGSWMDVMDLVLNEADQLNLLVALGSYFSYMPGPRMSLGGTIKPEILKTDTKNTVTFFGGSFHPFHMGHMNCLESCPENNIVVVPDFNPHKISLEKQAPLKTFYELCRILKDGPYSIYPGFLGKNAPNPTASWIGQVRVPEVNFLMGDDSFMNLFKWSRPEDVLSALTKLYVVPRDYERADYDQQLKKIQSIAPSLQVIFLPDHSFRKLSSTSFRNLK